MKGIKVNFLIIFAFILIAFFTSCMTEDNTVKQKNVIHVKTAPVSKKIVALPINTSGKLYASAELKLSFKIPGIIARIFVDQGKHVPKNTLLARLDLVEMKARVNQARSAFLKAERDLQRVKRLYADSVATLEQLQNTKTALDIARSDLRVAQFNLKHSEIYAPEDGKILKRFVEEGELVGSGTPILLYGSYQRGWVIRAGVTDKQIISLQIGDPASITFDAYPGKQFTAHVSGMEAAANPMTGTYEIELQLEATELKLFSGFVGRIIINPAMKQQYTFVPVEAMIEGDHNQGFVFAVFRETNSLSRQKISIAYILNENLLVSDGLENVDEVVTFGAPYLAEDSQINIIN